MRLTMRPVTAYALCLLVTAFATSPAPAQTSLTYQGRLKLNEVPLNGNCDLKVTLWDAASGGVAVTAPITIANVVVDKGLFTIAPDFGSLPWNGAARYLEIAVRTPPGGGTFTTLTPRQLITPSPYALHAEDSGEWNETGNNIWRYEGNLGIGSDNPVARLHIVGPGSSMATAIFDQPSGSNYIEFGSHLAPSPFTTGTLLSFTNNGVDTGRIASTSNGDLLFGTGASGSIRLSIGASGTVGIGSPALPDTRLALDSAPGYSIYMVGEGKLRAASSMELSTASGDINLVPIWGKSVHINPDGPGVTSSGDLFVNGQLGVGMAVDSSWGISSALSCQKLQGGSSWNVPSDRRAKEAIEPIHGAVDRLARLRPVSFRWREWYRTAVPSVGEGTEFNFIAQEFEEVFPGSCTPTSITTPDGGRLLSLNTSVLTPYTVAAIQELHERNTSLEAQLQQRTDELRELQSEVAALHTAVLELQRTRSGPH